MGLYTVFQMTCCLLSLLWALVVNTAALLAATARMLLRGDLLGAGGGAPLESNDQCAFYEGKVRSPSEQSNPIASFTKLPLYTAFGLPSGRKQRRTVTVHPALGGGVAVDSPALVGVVVGPAHA